MVEAARTTTFSPRYPAAARSFFTLLRSFGPRVISIPTSLAVGVPGTNNPTSVLIRLGSAPATAVMTSFWSSAESTTRRIAALSNGGNSWLKRRQPISPVRSLTVMTSFLLRFSCGTKSIVGFSHQSTSPLVERHRGGARVGYEIPHHPVDMDDLRASGEARLAASAGRVVAIFLKDDALAR